MLDIGEFGTTVWRPPRPKADALRPKLSELRAAVREAERRRCCRVFYEAAQMTLTAKLARRFGYDLATGRIDKAAVTLSSGSGLDVRITTRTNALDPFKLFIPPQMRWGCVGRRSKDRGRPSADVPWVVGCVDGGA